MQVAGEEAPTVVEKVPSVQLVHVDGDVAPETVE
jgi:hypothetical protein